jgi:hypothetical protein
VDLPHNLRARRSKPKIASLYFWWPSQGLLSCRHDGATGFLLRVHIGSLFLSGEISLSLSVRLPQSLFRHTISLSLCPMSASSFKYLKLSGEAVCGNKVLDQLNLDVRSPRPLMPTNGRANGSKETSWIWTGSADSTMCKPLPSVGPETSGF